MIRMTIAAATITASLTAAMAADMWSADSVMKKCKGSGFDLGYCTGINVGITHGAPWCLPDSGTMEQTIKVVTACVDARPARLHEHFATLALGGSERGIPMPKPLLSGRAALITRYFPLT
jgi:hypothetical protein